MPKVKINFLTYFLVFLYFLLCSSYITYPLALDLTHYMTGLVDELYVSWILNWNIHALLTDPLNLFHGNIYYPYKYTIAFSDPQFTSSLIALIPVVLTGEPTIAFTFTLILSYSLLGFSVFCLLKYLTNDLATSIALGTVAAFSTYIISKIGHLQVVAIYFIPFAILTYFLFINRKQFRYFLMTLIIFYLQFINSFMPAYMLFIILIFITIYEIFFNNKKIVFFINKKNLISIFILTIFCIPIVYPYYYISTSFNYVRDIRETIHTGNRPEYFFFNYGGSLFGPYLNKIFYQNAGLFVYDGYRGFINIILTFTVLVYFFFKKIKPKYFSFFTLSAIFFYILSLGPALQFGGKVIKFPSIIPLPYALFYYLAPGFKGFRNSGRIEVFEILMFCIAAGILLAYVFRKSLKIRIFISIFICIAVLSEFKFPTNHVILPSMENIPDIYKYLKSLPEDKVIAEFPIYNWDMAPYSNAENLRLFYSTFHFAKTINGTAGFSPSSWQENVRFLAQEFPNQSSIDLLKEMGVTNIIFHEKEFAKLHDSGYSLNGKKFPNSKIIESRLNNLNSIKLIKKYENDSVYEIID